MSHVALIYQPYRPETAEVAGQVRELLDARRVESELGTGTTIRMWLPASHVHGRDEGTT